MKKLFATFKFFITFIVLIIGTAIHLMYGSCQTSKFHYIIQFYYMQENLPSWMLLEVKPKTMGLDIYDGYTGEWKTWFKNGMIRSRVNFKNRILNGKSTSWYENGNMDSNINYLDGKLDGLYETWWENGIRWEKGLFIKGQETGKHESWHDNGNRNQALNYVNFKIDGKYEIWHPNGNKNYVRIYDNGKLISEERWDENGEKL